MKGSEKVRRFLELAEGKELARLNAEPDPIPADVLDEILSDAVRRARAEMAREAREGGA